MADDFKIIGGAPPRPEKKAPRCTLTMYPGGDRSTPQLVISVMRDAIDILEWKHGDTIVALEGTGKSLGVLLLRPHRPSDGRAGYTLSGNRAEGSSRRLFLRVSPTKMETLQSWPDGRYGPEPVDHQIFNGELKVTLPSVFVMKKDLLNG